MYEANVPGCRPKLAPLWFEPVGETTTFWYHGEYTTTLKMKPRWEPSKELHDYQWASMFTHFPSRRMSFGAGLAVFLAPIAIGFLGFVLGYIVRGMHP